MIENLKDYLVNYPLFAAEENKRPMGNFSLKSFRRSSALGPHPPLPGPQVLLSSDDYRAPVPTNKDQVNFPCELIHPRVGELHHRWLSHPPSSEAPCPRQASSNQLGVTKSTPISSSVLEDFSYLIIASVQQKKTNMVIDSRKGILYPDSECTEDWTGPWKMLIPVEILFFLTACYYRRSTKWKWKKYEWLESGVSLCVQAISNVLHVTTTVQWILLSVVFIT